LYNSHSKLKIATKCQQDNMFEAAGSCLQFFELNNPIYLTFMSHKW